MTANKEQERADLAAKDARIDALISRTDNLLGELASTVTEMKRILAAGQADVDEEKKISKGKRRA